MTAINAKNGYLAKGDALLPASQGPDEPVVSSTQIMTAPRFAQLQAAEAEALLHAATVGQHGGHDIPREGRVFESAKVIAGGAGSTLSLVPSLPGYDASGTQIAGHCPRRAADGSVNAAVGSSFLIDTDSLEHFADVPYEDAIGIEYNVGIAVSVVPSQAEQNPRTAKYELTQETAVIGVVSTPTLIAYDSGLNRTTLTLSNDKLNGNGSSLAGRSALAWYVDDDGYVLGETATAIQFGLLFWNGSNNEFRATGAFGQTLTAVDTTAANYRVCVLGPAVWAGAKETTVDGVAWIAHGDNDTAWDQDGQNRFPSTFGFLENFVRMSDPSASGADLVSLPKISIRPNDNEAGSSPQIQVWKDAAATTLAFQVDKDGNVEFDGGLSGVSGTTFPVGVDDAVVGRTSVFEMYHTHSPGVGVVGKGPRALFTVETLTEGVREPVGAVSGQCETPVVGNLQGHLILSAYGGSAELDTIEITPNGEAFAAGIGTSVISQVGVGGLWGSITDGPIGAAFSGVGPTIPQNAVASLNLVGSSANAARATGFRLIGRRAAGALVVQGQIEGYHDGALDDDLSKLAIKVNDGSALTSALIAEFFDDYTQPALDEVGCRINHIRGVDHPAVIIDKDSGVGAAGRTLLQLGEVYNHTTAVAASNNYTHRLSWHIESTDPFDDTVAHIGVGATTAGFDMRFVGFTPGVERLAMNVHYAATNKENRVEIVNGGFSILPIAFTADTGSPLRVIHNEPSGERYAGIDLCSSDASDTNGDRTTAINFFGKRLAPSPTETRVGGIRCHYDGVLGSGDFPGKMMLWVNGGGGAINVEHGIEIYSDGYVRSPTNPAWASVDHNGGSPVILNSLGFDTGFTITNPSAGIYVMQLAITSVGANINDPVIVQPKTDGLFGRGVWLSAVQIQIRVFSASSLNLVNDLAGFDVLAYASANVTAAP